MSTSSLPDARMLPWTAMEKDLLQPFVEGRKMTGVEQFALADQFGRYPKSILNYVAHSRKRRREKIEADQEALLKQIEVIAARKCSNCKELFAPETRFFFRCDRCLKNAQGIEFKG